jgi:hypothetical protein
MNKEQQELLGEAYKNYCKEYENGTHLIGTGLLWMAKETKGTFVYRSKTDPEFSEEWGLKIEERDLSLIERNNFLGDKKYTMLDGDYIWPTMIKDKEKYEKIFNETNIPTKLITITYNDKTIESYE